MSGHTYTHTHTHIHTYIHTYTHDNYYNPRCAHAHRGLIIPKIKRMPRERNTTLTLKKQKKLLVSNIVLTQSSTRQLLVGNIRDIQRR